MNQNPSENSKTKPMCSDPCMNFSEFVRAELQEQGMTQTELSKIVGIHINNLGGYVRGENIPTWYRAIDVLNALGYEVQVVKK